MTAPDRLFGVMRSLRFAAAALALLVQILAPGGAQISMARAMQAGESPICAPIHWGGKAPIPDPSPHRPDACCGLCGLVHAGVAPPAPAPALTPRAAARLVTLKPPPGPRLAWVAPRALRPPARASPAV